MRTNRNYYFAKTIICLMFVFYWINNEGFANNLYYSLINVLYIYMYIYILFSCTCVCIIHIISKKERWTFMNITRAHKVVIKMSRVLISGFCQYLHETHINCSIAGQFNLLINLILGRKNQPFFNNVLCISQV